MRRSADRAISHEEAPIRTTRRGNRNRTSTSLEGQVESELDKSRRSQVCYRVMYDRNFMHVFMCRAGHAMTVLMFYKCPKLIICISLYALLLVFWPNVIFIIRDGLLLYCRRI
jgi:hypothetical protein